MNAEEYAAWSSYMKSRRGTWTICKIHDGVNRDMIAFLPSEIGNGRGVYVAAEGSTLWAGTYEDGEAHIGDAIFTPHWGVTLIGEDEATTEQRKAFNYSCSVPSAAVLGLIFERLGIPFMLGAIYDVPMRSCP